MALEIRKPGLLTTIQDLGRPGYFHLGIPVGGAMDRLALRAANRLVGNDEGAAALEAVFMGPEFTVTEDTVLAVTGGEMPIKLDGEPVQTWTSFAAKKGQVVSFGYLSEGARIYIAVAGGIATEAKLGSRATYAIGALGGVDGRAVAAGDVLPVGEGDGIAGRTVPEALRRRPGQPAELRVLPGLYWHRITEASQKAFFEDEWKVAPEADRMGYRFRGGRPVDFVEREQPFGAGSDPSNIVDGCYPYGSIQVPGGTEPIVLHRDAVSGGGYFMIGAVISADMDLIGQLQPNVPVRFRQVDMDQALDARRARQSTLDEIRAALA
ncbi:urea amidolyase-related protein [Oceanicola granulosus HTCC2516]|uniref:Urea amidolyase-related protein n=1 Tax=Oceanicola granulosus (strain ATCC BAA-861 / DSM 15982 / KCTC 12143 / HTCC2516) TaxID=314256 RepID=Q2CGK5_OCEGH|nr:biotin-dependent carboxyltransferase family protein [Oceanicola granulosus]EAR51713.1 urea amidolyase-related protein [Oceanicola granulosus HTCC2516]